MIFQYESVITNIQNLNGQKYEAMGQNFEQNRNSKKIEFFKDVRPISNIFIYIFVEFCASNFIQTEKLHRFIFLCVQFRIFMIAFSYKNMTNRMYFDLTEWLYIYENYDLHSWGTQKQKSSFVPSFWVLMVIIYVSNLDDSIPYFQGFWT